MRNAVDRDAARRNTRMRFEQWAKNPACEANTVSAVHNVRMAEVAKSVGLESSFGQSPFAIARGLEFERQLLAKDGERLRDELFSAGVLPAGAEGFLDLRLRMNGGRRVKTLDQALEETTSLIGDVVTGVGVPALVAGATVKIPRGVMLPEAILIIDALVIRADLQPVRFIVGSLRRIRIVAGSLREVSSPPPAHRQVFTCMPSMS